jgi:hypothetical protein
MSKKETLTFGWLQPVVVAVLIALVAGGTAPWWWPDEKSATQNSNESKLTSSKRPQEALSTAPTERGPIVHGDVNGGVVATTTGDVTIDRSTTIINPLPPKKLFSSCIKTLEDMGEYGGRFRADIKSKLYTTHGFQIRGYTVLVLSISNRFTTESTENGIPESVGSLSFRFEEENDSNPAMDPRFKASSGEWKIAGFCSERGLQIELSDGKCENRCAGGDWIESVYTGQFRTDGQTAYITFSSSPFSGSPLSIKQNSFKLLRI